MRPTPLVSVIVPAYQAQETLGAALSGALTQTYPRVEIVVCNDGSTDATDAIASAYGDLVRVVRQPNGGLPSARNAAIRAARGDLIALLDADDLWFPPHVQAAVQMLGRIPDGRGLVSCNSYYLTPYGTNPRRTVFARGYPIPADEQRMRIADTARAGRGVVVHGNRGVGVAHQQQRAGQRGQQQRALRAVQR